MNYQSTRGQGGSPTFSGAFSAGLAPDGGLYVPRELPDLTAHLPKWSGLSYADLALEFFTLFDTDHTRAELADLVGRSYGDQFAHPDAAPLHRLQDGLDVLELFHGPTLAFKDFGLQLLGNLFEDQIARSGKPINVLGATSGDTGAAAISGLANKQGARVFILYPHGRISELQERQMTCTGAENIFPIPIKGSFDDAQKIIKEIFGDLEMKQRLGLSAINSINLARILAQSVYYIAAWLKLTPAEREHLRFVVPTGNFGNILAGWLAARMGLPVESFQVATNQNDILYRLFTNGRYESGAVAPSLAPSMDIQVASNFERFLFYHCGQDGAKTADLMAAVASGESLDVPGFDPAGFFATRCDDTGIRDNIARVHRDYGYTIDPHTACGFEGIDPNNGHTVVLSTAHPAKFPDTIIEATGEDPKHPTLEALRALEPVTYPCEPTVEAVRTILEAKALVS